MLDENDSKAREIACRLSKPLRFQQSVPTRKISAQEANRKLTANGHGEATVALGSSHSRTRVQWIMFLVWATGCITNTKLKKVLVKKFQ